MDQDAPECTAEIGDQDGLYKDAAAQFGGALERLARSYEADADKRRDLIQDIHLAVWKSFAGFDGRCSLRTWVYRVAHNAATSYVIKARRIADKHARLEDVHLEMAFVDGREEAGRRETLERLYELIAQLNLVDHAVIVLYLEGESAASIGEVTGLSPGNVATKIHRIKNLLARGFQSGAEDGAS